MILLLDYGIGNLASVRKALEHLGQSCQITSRPEDLARNQPIVLSGVGHFGATKRLDELGLREAIREEIGRGTPLLGICVGMQWLFEGSQEAPPTPGLGVFAGHCGRFPDSVKSPHVGWNQIEPLGPSRLLNTLPRAPFVYYTHSFRAPLGPGAVASTDYGEPFAAVVERDNVFGVQFHPEKSGLAGLQVLRNFCSLSC